MRTAIVYRANKHLDANLLPLKEKVEFLVRFEPTDLPADKDLLDEKVRQALTDTIADAVDVHVKSDLTCSMGAFRFVSRDETRISIISQEDSPLEAHIRKIADEGMPVVLVRENLADHVQIDGVNLCNLDDQDLKPGGWYHAKVLAVWTTMLRTLGVEYLVVHASEIIDDVPRSAIVVCDHHYANNHVAVRRAVGWRNAFMSLPPGKFVKPEDLLSHCL